MDKIFLAAEISRWGYLGDRCPLQILSHRYKWSGPAISWRSKRLAIRRLSDYHIPPAKGARPFDLPTPMIQIISRGAHPSCRTSLLSPHLLLIDGSDLCAGQPLRQIDSGGWHGNPSSPANKSEGESHADLLQATCPSLNGSRKSNESRQTSILRSSHFSPPSDLQVPNLTVITSPASGVPHHHLITLGPLLINSPGKRGNRAEKLSRDSIQFPRPQTEHHVAQGICPEDSLGFFSLPSRLDFCTASSPSILLGSNPMVGNLSTAPTSASPRLHASLHRLIAPKPHPMTIVPRSCCSSIVELGRVATTAKAAPPLLHLHSTRGRVALPPFWSLMPCPHHLIIVWWWASPANCLLVVQRPSMPYQAFAGDV